MSVQLYTYDNNDCLPLHVEGRPFDDLHQIAGIPVSKLCADNEGLLLFPGDLEEYGDKIGDSPVYDFRGNHLVTGNVMGFLQVGETMLKIGSRFDRGQNDFFMQYMLQKVFSVNMFDMDYSSSFDSIFDFLLFLFPYYLKRALQQGLYKEYRTFKNNDPKLKGVLDVNRHIRLNYPSTGNIAYRSREYSYDNNLTQLVRHAIELIAATPYGAAILNNDEATKDAVAAIRSHTPSYSKNDRRFVLGKNIRPKPSPYYLDYEPLRKLCIQILNHEGIKYGREESTVYGVLFDGAWLWEEYLSMLLEPIGITHPRNKTGEGRIYLFDNHTAPRYPDFLGEDIVLDAKYKRYAAIRPQDIGREDLAQVISYMYVEKAHTAVILCPGGEKFNPSTSHLRGYGGEVVVMNLPILSAGSFEAFADNMANQEALFTASVGKMI